MPVIKKQDTYDNCRICDDKDEKKEVCVHNEEKNEKCEKNGIESLFSNLFEKIELDDLILIGLIIFLLYEGEDNFITIGILLLILFL